MAAVAGTVTTDSETTVTQIEKVTTASQTLSTEGAGYLETFGTAGTQLGTDLITPLGDVETGIDDVGESAAILGDVGYEGLFAFKENALLYFGEIVLGANDAANAIRDITTAASEIPPNINPLLTQGSGPGDIVTIPGKARGGPLGRGEMAWVGENGRELIVPGFDASILNNATSRRIIDVLSGLGGGMFSGGNTTYNISMNTVFNTRTEAQSVGAAGRISKAARGFGG